MTAAGTRTTPAGFGAAAVASIVWGLGNVVVTGTPLNGMAQATHRFWLGALLYLACLYGSGRRLSWASFRAGWLGGLALAGDIAFFFVAVKHTTLADAATIGALQPIVILLTAGALFGEKVRPRHIVCTVLALAGTVAVVKGSASSGGQAVTLFGEVMAALSLLSWAWYFIVSKTARQRLDTLEYMTVIMIVGTVVVAPIALVTGQLTGPDSHLTWEAFFWVAVIVLLPGSGHVLINWAHNHTTITTSSLLTLLIPVLSAAGGALWLDQELVGLQIGGIAVVLVALALVILLDARTARREVEVLERLP